MNRAFLITIWLLSIATAAAAADSGDFHWSGRLAPGQVIEIKGISGDIHAVAASGPEAQVSAHKTAHRSDPSQVRIEAVPSHEGVTICAVYPPANGRANECRPGSGGHMNTRDNDVKVEFTVQVPAGVRFDGRTVNGAVEAAGLGADAEAHTVNGNIKLATSGAAQANTVNGNIDASIGSAAWTGSRSFETVNGSVNLSMPANLNADLRAGTVNGHIDSDFPITVQGRFGPKNVSARIGSGGRELKINTVNGSIGLHRPGGKTL